MLQFVDNNKVVTAKKGFGSLHATDDPAYAALHSEPPINEDRFYFAVQPVNNHELALWIEQTRAIMEEATRSLAQVKT